MRRGINPYVKKCVLLTRLTVMFFLVFARELHAYNNLCEGKKVMLTRHFVLDVIMTVTCFGMRRVG